MLTFKKLSALGISAAMALSLLAFAPVQVSAEPTPTSITSNSRTKKRVVKKKRRTTAKKRTTTKRKRRTVRKREVQRPTNGKNVRKRTRKRVRSSRSGNVRINPVRVTIR